MKLSWRGELCATLRYNSPDRDRPLSEDGPSVDKLLENLQKRPSVKATLILSRKDGSIIRASGAEFTTTADSLASTGQHEESAPQDSDVTIQSEDNVIAKEVKPTRLQILAGCIFAHVASAAALGDVLQESKSTDTTGPGNPDRKSEHEDQVKKYQHDDDVQLLRLRFRKQEVIIFPDPSYLCCVIQDTEKSAR